MSPMRSLLGNHTFAFLHGFIHPLVILPFARRKRTFLAVAIGTGCLTLGEFWLLEDVLEWQFVHAKAVLALTTAMLGFGWVLGCKPSVALAAVATAAALAGFSHAMLAGFHAHAGTALFPALVIGQLAIYFAGFMAVRRWTARSAKARQGGESAADSPPGQRG